MKFLEITEDVEKVLVSIFDGALKSGGLAVHHLINQVTAAIKHAPAAPVVPPVSSSPVEE